MDVTQISTEGVVGSILRLLGDQRKLKVGIVDWLNRLDNDGRLGKFLALK